MGTPAAGTKEAALYDFVGLRVQEYVRAKHFAYEHLVDVGAGWGKYKLLLPEFRMDAVEVWAPYVAENNLATLYEKVYLADILAWFPERHYGAAIFGDSFEHLTQGMARVVLDRLKGSADEVIVAIPYEMKQGESEGNPYERHLQDDLTPSVMHERYPELRCIAEEGNRAVYVG